MPTNAPSAFRGFTQYSKVITPNGGAIHLVAQDRISIGQIVRCREILKMFLTDIPDSQYGSAKAAVTNRMAANASMLM